MNSLLECIKIHSDWDAMRHRKIIAHDCVLCLIQIAPPLVRIPATSMATTFAGWLRATHALNTDPARLFWMTERGQFQNVEGAGLLTNAHGMPWFTEIQ